MTTSLFVTYRVPDDAAAFDKSYFDGHVPLVNKMPGLLENRVNKVVQNIAGEQKLYVITELVFENAEAAQKALGSEEGKATSVDLASWGGDKLASIYLSERAV
ncbi:uncharacterized protein (TIGR02118 family) [Antricoccus suffuscus]|uniref:Uncharacterized protein (TIGR02118 family) n=1 Tax=Antricoccus suffuscus TaxID=1629062 RepID=A0A2T1A6W7_9ACTN|nr:EthD family reductase [Antricoccus suffuscus]PRZ44217.1 uncharacterized protein (TIGR02118 family) [Antricoccus suffuscus]